MKTRELEMKISKKFCSGKNLVACNVSTGFFKDHEADILVFDASEDFAHEIELKISESDLAKDFDKKSDHFEGCVAFCSYAFPDEMLEYAKSVVPENYGLLSVGKTVKVKREPQKNESYTPMKEGEKNWLIMSGFNKFWRQKKKNNDHIDHNNSLFEKAIRENSPAYLSTMQISNMFGVHEYEVRDLILKNDFFDGKVKGIFNKYFVAIDDIVSYISMCDIDRFAQ